ncbi:type II toxin-antitoxin system VapC family toxin [Sulfuriferula sp.]|uniref:type II toxin-antitoxin system VapC family toxin n=1 Tax=Sulfuriferula sp. TaxID=2025307 RepID=UPI00272F1BE6|nr:type II toxin-antitoxin system VapC family toxin [Sulfuriferula sp.]MDP2024993.1 type II toxin-antitoxin system VapC family toxin [Sulfuriferula sp.]
MPSGLLLDTHIALWWFSGNARLGSEVRDEISRSECWLSAVSVWEVAIKFRLGKLPVAPGLFLATATDAGMRLLSIIPEHAVATAELTAFHTDPFDRLLIAQARQEHLSLLTADRALLAYGSNVRLAE